MIHLDEILKEAPKYKHHAFLLVSSFFAKGPLSPSELKRFGEAFCGMSGEQEGAEGKPFSHPDLSYISPKGQTMIKVEDVRALEELTYLPPTFARRRLIFIERCDKLSLGAANALLKILEEPRAPVCFMLTTPKEEGVLETIKSRCQKLTLRLSRQALEEFEDIESAHKEWMRSYVSFLKEDTYLYNLAQKNFPSLPPHTLQDILSMTKVIAERYSCETLMDYLICEFSKKLRQDVNLIFSIKYFLKFLISWKEHQGFNVSNDLWLFNLFVRMRSQA
jgi:hypothetical protein